MASESGTRLLGVAILVAACCSCAQHSGSAQTSVLKSSASKSPATLALVADKCLSCHAVATDDQPALDSEHIDASVAERALGELLAGRMPPTGSQIELSPDEREFLLDWFCHRAALGGQACDALAEELRDDSIAPVPSTYVNMSLQLTGQFNEPGKAIQRQLQRHIKPRATSVILDATYLSWAALLAVVQCQAPGAATIGKVVMPAHSAADLDACVAQHLDVLLQYTGKGGGP